MTSPAISRIPRESGIYALMGGSGQRAYVAYVGLAKKLRSRVRQHLVLRDSSVATGRAAVGLNPDHVTEVRWWVLSGSGLLDGNDEQAVLEATEIIAIETLDPALRSRGNATERALRLASDRSFAKRGRAYLAGPPTGTVNVDTLQDAVERIAELEGRLEELESLVRRLRGS